MRSKSGSMIFFRRNPAGSFTVVVWVSTFVFSAVGADVFPSGASVFPLPARESYGRLSSPKELIRRSSDASVPRRLRYGDASEGLLQVCQFLLMNPWYNVFEIEYSLYGHKARVFGFMF